MAEPFEPSRTHLRAVAYRMLGSLSEADDAVQEAWLRLSRCDAKAIGNRAARRRSVEAVIQLGFRFSGPGRLAQPAVVNGAPGVVVSHGGRPASVVGFTVRGGKLVAIDMLADPARIGKLDLAALDE